MRTVIITLAILASSFQAQAQDRPAPPQTFQELSGMFTHAGGWTDVQADDIFGWVWGHENAPAGCSNKYLYAVRWDTQMLTYIGISKGYEQYCVSGDWVYLMGYGSYTPDVWFAPVTVGPQLGQRYAPVTLSRVAFCETGLITGAITLGFTDCQTWSPVPGGWVQHETYQYTSGAPSTWMKTRYTGIVTMKPRDMYVSGYRHWEVDGVLTGQAIRTITTFTW